MSLGERLGHGGEALEQAQSAFVGKVRGNPLYAEAFELFTVEKRAELVMKIVGRDYSGIRNQVIASSDPEMHSAFREQLARTNIAAIDYLLAASDIVRERLEKDVPFQKTYDELEGDYRKMEDVLPNKDVRTPLQELEFLNNMSLAVQGEQAGCK